MYQTFIVLIFKLACHCKHRYGWLWSLAVPSIISYKVFSKYKSARMEGFLLSQLHIDWQRAACDNFHFFQFFSQEVADILQISKAIDATKKPQPFVVCKGTLLAPTQTFVILERRPVRQESLLKAIDFCFKAMYILDMAYQPSCCLVWQFIQNVIYEIKEAHVPSCIRDLRSFLAFKSN